MATLGFGDEGWEREEEHGLWQKTRGVAPVTNRTYEAECSACHFAYPPGLLPERSWVRIMNSLSDHFGDNAELDQKSWNEILVYLRGHSADQVPNRFSRSLMRSIEDGDTPLRITQTPFFKHKHREIPSKMVSKNPDVRSFSNCVACHAMAKKGYFDEEGVRIPGYGYWDD